jgi:phospholipase C
MSIDRLQRIEHVVVLMLENRSFDNLLGWLYDPSNQPPFNQVPANFDGISGKNLSNPVSPGSTRRVPVAKGTNLTAPNPDPGEPYQDVYAQIYGPLKTPPLGKVPPKPTKAAKMRGFVYNYAKQSPAPADPAIIMNGFTPASVPVLASLAHFYGLCDHWFSSIPTQTLCNRSFVHAGTSSGYVNNEGGNGIIFQNDTTTVFDLLSGAGKSWKIYCGGWILTSLSLLTQEKLWPRALEGGYFAHIDDFIADAGKPGGLPHYSFLEPNYIDSLWWGPENDMHPEANAIEFYGPSNVAEGERLLYKVYHALRTSPDWNKTLLVIVFDEHGGCYDHVVPPTSRNCRFAISPGGKVIPPTKPGGSGFRFDRLGVRVPAVIVSPFTPPGTILNNPFDHTSVLSTLVNAFGLPSGQLGHRQENAPDVSAALSLATPRTDHPPTPQPPAPSLWDRAVEDVKAFDHALLHSRGKPLTGLQAKILSGALSRLGMPWQMFQEAEQAKNAIEADSLLVKLEAHFLGRRYGPGRT